MKCWSIGLVASLCATFACANAPVAPADAAAAPAARPGMFAAGAAPYAKRLTPEQRDEWRFLKEASAAGQFEHEAARIALARSADTHVRSLAAQIEGAHADSLHALQSIMQARGMAPAMLTGDQRKALNRLDKLQGSRFDREWLDAVALRSRQERVAAFERAAASARDPQVRAWIDRTLPTLRSQLQAAERAAKGGTKYAKLAPRTPIKGPPAGADGANVPARYVRAGAASVNLTGPNTR